MLFSFSSIRYISTDIFQRFSNFFRRFNSAINSILLCQTRTKNIAVYMDLLRNFRFILLIQMIMKKSISFDKVSLQVLIWE